MADFFRITGLPGLEGLVAEVAGECPKEGVAEVCALINTNVVVGDRNVKFPFPDRALYIDSQYLKLVPDPFREYDAKNPFGSVLFEGHYKKNDLEVAYVVFDNALSATIFEKHKDGSQKTIFSQNFFDSAIDARAAIEDVLREDDEVEDLVFRLKELKEQETE
jgi:hypothetical protein